MTENIGPPVTPIHRMMPLMTVKEVAGVLRLSKSKVYQLIEQGVLLRVRLPGCDRVLIDPADLWAYRNAGRGVERAHAA